MLPPALGASIWFMLLIFLYLYDPAIKRATSKAVWLPSIWMFFAGSRLPAQWSGLTPISATTAFEEGSGLDRTFFLILTVLGLWILARRRLNWPDVFAANFPVTLFIVFALASVTWSDFPFISLKRWIRDLTMYVMILVVLSDTRPFEAIGTVLRRFSYVLLFSSVILIKYYPEVGITYNVWTGAAEYIGATTSKNMLGVVCLISGLFLFWDAVERWPQRKLSKIKRILIVDAVLIAMTLWLLDRSQSATSKICFILGCLIIAAFRTRWVKTNPRRLSVAILPVLAAYLVLELAFDFSSMVAPLVGRDPTLTGRTEIWNMVLALRTNPIVGVGYQSFWLGDRLAAIVSRSGFLNEAHNGYLETYLNLGFVGLALITLVMIFSHRTVRRRLTLFPHFAPLSLAFWVLTLIYNVTEAAFGAGLLWSVFLLLCVIVVPRSTAKLRSEGTETLPLANMRTQNDCQRRATLPSGVHRSVPTT